MEEWNLETAMQNLVPFWSYVSLNFKEGCFQVKNYTFLYIRPFILNGSSIRSENCPIELENFKESNGLSHSAKSCAILELYLVEFEKRLFLTQKWHLSIYLSLHSKRIECLVWKSKHSTKSLPEIEFFELQFEILCRFEIMPR